jgi:flagellar biosynthetic protein FliQ
LRANGSRECAPDDSEAIHIARNAESWMASSQGLLAMTGVGFVEKEWNGKMTGAETLDVARDAIWTIVVVSSPLMVVGLVVGVVVSLFQALTQIQEQTLVFVPKILAIFVTLLLALPFMADSLHSHMMRISSRIIGG